MSILDSIPDISFIGDISVEKLKEIGINEYKSALSEITSETVTQISDEDKAKIYAQAQIMYQVAEIINNRARQNSLKYASGAYLDNKAISRLLQRKQEEYAVTTIRFTLSAAQTRSQTTLKKQSRLLARRQPLDDLQETLALIPHIKSIANSPSSERSLRPPLFPLALTLPMRFPHHHIHTCNPRLSS